MTKLGKNQLDTLAGLARVYSAVVVPDKLMRSLERRGLMMALRKERGTFLVLTPAGYRAIADALEQGAVVRPPLSEWVKGP